jgi:2-keto-4-pentenoate hydratase
VTTGDTSLVDLLAEAQTARGRLEPVEVELPLERAYDAQRRLRAVRVAAGERLVGRKIGLSSVDARATWNADEPVSGHLLSSTVTDELESFSLRGLASPRVEAEIALVLGSPLHGEQISPGEVLAATSRVHISLEIVASRWPGGPPSLGHLVADNVNAAGVLLGPTVETSSITGDVTVNVIVGDTVTPGRSAEVYGHPLKAVAWLAAHLTRSGERLESGDLVMSGSLNVPVAVSPGDALVADFGSLGVISTRFSG